MLSLNTVERRFGTYICRRCINRRYRANLEQKDCVYAYYYQCPSCGKDHHIVVGLQPSGHLKMLLK